MNQQQLNQDKHNYNRRNPNLQAVIDPIHKLIKTDSEIISEVFTQYPTVIPNLNQDNHNNLIRLYDVKNIQFCNEDYSYLSNLLLVRFAQSDSARAVAREYPLYKILRGIVKKFMFNELEIIFFLHIIQENGWKYNHELVTQFAKEFNYDFLNIVHEVSKQDEYRSLILYLVSCAYAIKGYLNDQNEISIINAHINQSVKLENFQKYMEKWRSNFMSGGVKIMPRVLNKVFVGLTKSGREQSQQVQDYNALVDQIIQISPPYNSEKQNQLKVEQQVKQEQMVFDNKNMFQIQPTNFRVPNKYVILIVYITQKQPSNQFIAPQSIDEDMQSSMNPLQSIPNSRQPSCQFNKDISELGGMGLFRIEDDQYSKLYNMRNNSTFQDQNGLSRNQSSM